VSSSPSVAEINQAELGSWILLAFTSFLQTISILALLKGVNSQTFKRDKLSPGPYPGCSTFFCQWPLLKAKSKSKENPMVFLLRNYTSNLCNDHNNEINVFATAPSIAVSVVTADIMVPPMYQSKNKKHGICSLFPCWENIPQTCVMITAMELIFYHSLLHPL